MVRAALNRIVDVRPDELPLLVWSFIYHFCLLCGYFMIRPVRDAIAVEGVGDIPWLFTVTFLVMLSIVPLYGAIVSRFSRRVFLPLVYIFFTVNLLVFYGLIKSDWQPYYVARSFFVWVSVFNLFTVSVFWSFMADIYKPEQSRRLFGFIAAGGSSGALCGPLITAQVARYTGGVELVFACAGFLGLATLCIRQLRRYSAATVEDQRVDQQTLGGGVLEGARRVVQSPYLLGASVFMLSHNICQTFLYNMRARMLNELPPGSTSVLETLAWIDFSVNVASLIMQALLTVSLVKTLGMATTLSIVPSVLAVGFSLLGIWTTVWPLIVLQVCQRSMNYGILGPTKEMLFTVVDRQTKYKSKNFIDTVVYRGSDVTGTWLYRGGERSGLLPSALAWTVVPLAIVWFLVAIWLGRRYERARRLNTVIVTAH